MGWDIAGSKDIIKSVTRADFVSYMKQLYSASNMVLVVAGNFDEDELKKLLEMFEKVGHNPSTNHTHELISEFEKFEFKPDSLASTPILVLMIIRLSDLHH